MAARSGDFRRSYSLNPHHKRQSPIIAPSSGSGHNLPLHLQDPHYSWYRRRRPSSLSTHSYDPVSPIPRISSHGPSGYSPMSAHGRSNRPRSNAHFVFPPVYSPTSPLSYGGDGVWSKSPDQSFNQCHYSVPISPGQQSCSSYSMDYLSKPSPIIRVKPQYKQHSVDYVELQSFPTESNRTLTNVQSLDILDKPSTKHNSNKYSSIRLNYPRTSFKKYHTVKEMSPTLPITPTGHTPSMRLSFDMLEKQTSYNTYSGSRRCRNHIVYPPIGTPVGGHSDRNKTTRPSSNRRSCEILEQNPVSSNTKHSIGACKSFDFIDGNSYMYHGGSASLRGNNWYDGSHSSLSGVSTCAVVHHHCNNRWGCKACECITPVNIKPLHSHCQLRRELLIVIRRDCDYITPID